ncbi:MAG: fumarate hydratase C-terminal domain-containing protein [Candidatus Hydrogenedentes bacterium]|nr:fumarate hydratase C-terminal domain-containing protein [Candidatus Hydrogenedentota bacterium]
MKIPTEIKLPLNDETVRGLAAGDRVLLTGRMYGARDAVHKRFVDLLAAGKPLPVDLHGEIIFYVGPSPAAPNRIIGAVGPTTSSRMDPYVESMLAQGLKGTIGKGPRSEDVRQAYKRHGAVHFAATGGTAALLSRCVVSFEVVAYEELGPESFMRFEVDKMPVIVAIDGEGRDMYVRCRDSAGSE